MAPHSENLKMMVPGTPEARAFASMGGKASAAAKRVRKNMQQLASMMLAQPLPEDKRVALKQHYKNIDPDDLTAQAAVIAGQIASATRGNSMAFQALIELQKQEEERIIAAEVIDNKPYHFDLDIVGDAFHPIARAVRRHTYREFVLHGGRASLKSSYVSCQIIEILRNNPNVHACIFRRVGMTLKDSVYSQIKWAIGMQDLTEEFDERKNPLEITLKATGQKIYFRGADKPEKIKSIKPPFGYIGVAWYEELDQFEGEKEVRNIEQSAIRGGDDAWIFKTFNPPKSADNWANKYIRVPKPTMLVHHSTYLEAPPEWLGQPFIEEAEHLKRVNPEAYEHEYLGVANGAGGYVFTQVELRTITDDEIQHMDHIYQGVDWGLAPDPYCFERVHYDRDSETIYFIDEHKATGSDALNRQTAAEIQRRGYDDMPVTCDSAEKKSTLDYRDLGINARNARKGPGSVEYGIKWLAGRRIIIDPERNPLAAQEFTHYEFERDKEGNLISGYPDKNNHSIDATRYALEKFCNERFNPA